MKRVLIILMWILPLPSFACSCAGYDVNNVSELTEHFDTLFTAIVISQKEPPSPYGLSEIMEIFPIFENYVDLKKPIKRQFIEAEFFVIDAYKLADPKIPFKNIFITYQFGDGPDCGMDLKTLSPVFVAARKIDIHHTERAFMNGCTLRPFSQQVQSDIHKYFIYGKDKPYLSKRCKYKLLRAERKRLNYSENITPECLKNFDLYKKWRAHQLP